MIKKLKQHFPIILLAVGHGAVDFYVGLLAVVAPGLAAFTGIPLGNLVFLVGVASLVNNLSQMLVGYVMGGRNLAWVLWAGVALAALPSFMGLAPGYWTLAALVLLGAFGTGIYHPEGALAAHDATGEKAYLGVPLFMSGGAFVAAVGTPLSIAMAERFGYGSLALLALPGLLVAGTLLAQYRARRRERPSQVLRPRSMRKTKAEPGKLSFWPLLALAVCFNIANGLFMAILATHYELTFGPTARVMAGWLLSLVGVTASLSSFLWSSLSRKYGFYPVAALTQLAVFPFFLLLAYPASPTIGLLFTIPVAVLYPNAVFPTALALARNASGLTQGLRTGILLGGTSALSALAVMAAGGLLRRGFSSSYLLVFIALCSLGTALIAVWQILMTRRRGEKV